MTIKEIAKQVQCKAIYYLAFLRCKDPDAVLPFKYRFNNINSIFKPFSARFGGKYRRKLNIFYAPSHSCCDFGIQEVVILPITNYKKFNNIGRCLIDKDKRIKSLKYIAFTNRGYKNERI